MLQRVRAILLLELALGAVVAAAIFKATFTSCLEKRGIDTFDASIPIDGAWRLYCGQVPFRDFSTPYGLTLFAIQAAFFKLAGGFSFRALAWHAGTVGGLVVLVVQLVARLRVTPGLALGAGALAGLCFYLPDPVPWGDPTAQLFILFALAPVMIVDAEPRCAGRAGFGLAAVSGLALAATLFSKQSAGAAATVLVPALWMFEPTCRAGSVPSRERRFLRVVTCLAAEGLAVATAVVFLERQGRFLEAVRISSQQAGRTIWLLPWRGRFGGVETFFGSLDLVLAGLVLAILAFAWLKGRRHLWRRVDAGGALVVLGITYGSRKLAIHAPEAFACNLPLALLFLITLARDLPGPRPTHERGLAARAGGAVLVAIGAWIVIPRVSGGDFRALALGLAAVLAGAGVIAPRAVRKRFLGGTTAASTLGRALQVLLVAAGLALGIEYVAIARAPYTPPSFSVGPARLVPVESVPGLDGAWADERTVPPLVEVVRFLSPRLDALKARGEARDGLYVFPSGQLLYAVLGVESFRGVPLFFHPGLSFSKWTRDPGLPLLESRRPRYVVVARYGYSMTNVRPWGGAGPPGVTLDHFMDGTKSWLLQSYEPRLDTGEFLVLERRS